MSEPVDIGDSIRRITEGLTARPESDIAFRGIRARVRGVMIDAHRALSQGMESRWTEADDRMLDITAAWLDDVRGRKS
jgi:hypothetical protein